MTGIKRYWGYILFAGLLTAWWTTDITVGILVPVSVLVVFYFLFRVPVWCGAVTRGGQLCRNNSNGLLLGCHLREHKWQRVKLVMVPRAWRKVNEGLWTNATTSLATISTLLAIVTMLVGLVQPAVA